MTEHVNTEAIEAISSQITAELYAQLDDLSADTYDTIRKYECVGDTAYNAALLAIAEDLRETLIATLDQRLSDWQCDNMPAIETCGICNAVVPSALGHMKAEHTADYVRRTPLPIHLIAADLGITEDEARAFRAS